MTVERCGTIDGEEFRERFAKPRRPVVLQGAIDAWDARRKWSFTYFQQKYGHRMVRFRGQPEPMQLAGYIDSLGESSFAHPVPYLRNLNIQTDWPELVADISPALAYSRPDWLSSRLMPKDWPRPRHLNQLFFSGTGTWISLHYDDWMTHNIVSNLVGEKEFMLFEHDQGRFLYPRPNEYLVSRIPNAWDVDPVEFPDFARARQARVTIGPGESLFVPCGWWHTTRTLSPCISVSSSFAGRDNWRLLVNEVRHMRSQHGAVGLKTRLLCAYLAWVGVLLSGGIDIRDALTVRSRKAP